MPDLVSISSALQEPLHSRVRQHLRQLLEEFSDEERFYSVRELISKLKVSQPTVRKALLDLASEGYLTASPRRGFFVRKNTEKRHVGVMTPGYKLTLGLTMVEILANACRNQEMELHSYYILPSDSIDDALKMIRNKPSDERIILMGLEQQFSKALIEKLRLEGYTYLVVDDAPRGQPCRSVGVDEEMSFKLVLNHFESLGHQRMLFLVNEPVELLSTIQRVAIAKSQINGHPQAHIVSCDTKNWASSFDAAYTKVGEILSQKTWPTAICPLSGVGAWAVLRYCMERGIRIPQDISLICYEPLPGTELLPIPLTALSYSHAQIAETAVQLLWTDNPATYRKLIKPELVARASTGPALK